MPLHVQNIKQSLFHVSTDYVFDGETNLDYSEDDFTNPIGVYGESKRAGEELALESKSSDNYSQNIMVVFRIQIKIL